MANNVTLCGKSTTGVITSPGSQTKPAVEEVKATSNAIHVAIATLQAGDDETNNVKVVEQGQFLREYVGASATAQVCGDAGAAGDFIHTITFCPITTSPGVCYLLDNATSMQIFTGGASSLVDLKPFTVELNLTSVEGPWKFTTGANIRAIISGRFS